MTCKNLKLTPQSDALRNLIGAVDRCKHIKKVKGVTIYFSQKNCPFEKICKHFEQQTG